MTRAASVVLVSVLALSSVARAQEASERAMQLFEESRGHYDAGRFDLAASLLEEAHRLQPDPILLYNIARAYEGAGRLQEAADTYERYLGEAGEVRDRGAIERRVVTLREQIARQRELEERARDEGQTPGATRSAAPSASTPSGAVDPAPWVITGVGLAGVGVGIALGVLSEDAHAQAIGEPVHMRAVELQQSAYDLATGANVAFIAGGAVALGGLVWAIVSLTSSGSRERAALRPAPGGVALLF